MSSAFRHLVIVAAATALLSTQAAHAARSSAAPAVDPLVSLSVLGTTQSRAAVCAVGAQCTLPSATVAASASTAAAAQPYDARVRRGPGIWPLLIGLGLVIILAAIILSDDGDDADGDLTPISP